MSTQVFKVHHQGLYDLTTLNENSAGTLVKIPDLIIRFAIGKPSRVFISGKIGCNYREIALAGTYIHEYTEGLFGRLEHTNEWGERSWIEYSEKGSSNFEARDNDVIFPLTGYLEVEPGTHEISFWGTEQISIIDVNSNVEIENQISKKQKNSEENDLFNQMIVRVEAM